MLFEYPMEMMHKFASCHGRDCCRFARYLIIANEATKQSRDDAVTSKNAY